MVSKFQLGLSENKNTHFLAQIALTDIVRAILLSERIEIEKMDILQETVAVYERLRKKRYRIIVDTGEDFTFTFQPANYHHLAGFQHLTDFRNISSPKKQRPLLWIGQAAAAADRIYSEKQQLSRNRRTFAYIRLSGRYSCGRRRKDHCRV